MTESKSDRVIEALENYLNMRELYSQSFIGFHDGHRIFMRNELNIAKLRLTKALQELETKNP